VVRISDSGVTDVGSNPTGRIRPAGGNALLGGGGPRGYLAHFLDFLADQIGFWILLLCRGVERGFRRVDPVREVAGFLGMISFKNFSETSAEF
jgi:hypothetical protein